MKQTTGEYQTTTVGTIAELETVTYTDIGCVRGTDLLVDVFHGSIRISFIIGSSLSKKDSVLLP